MELHVLSIVLAAFLVSLVAGFLVAFALVAMPGLGRLGDREFVRAFQEMDGIIQRSHPLFVLLWVGSVLALLGAAVLSWSALGSPGRWLLGGAAAAYFAGVQLPTATINIPLNNRLQAVEAQDADEATLRQARAEFESRWNRWNRVRALFAMLASILLVALLGLYA